MEEPDYVMKFSYFRKVSTSPHSWVIFILDKYPILSQFEMQFLPNSVTQVCNPNTS